MKLNRYIFVLAIATLAHASTSNAIFVGDGSASSDLVNIFNLSGGLMSTIAPSGGFDFPAGIAVGPTGNVYIANESSGAPPQVNADVYEYNGTSLTPLVPYTGGSLGIPTGVAIGPDGNLYVADGQNGLVDEFNAATGAFITTYVSANSLSSPEGIAFGPNGDLYIADAGGIEQWDGATLTNFAFINGAVTDLAFGPGGDLYATDTTNGLIRVFNTSGADIMDFGQANLGQPIGLAFGPDGNLYVTGFDPSSLGAGAAAAIMSFDPLTGAFIQDLVTYNGTNFINPQFIAFGTETPEPSTLLLGLFGLGGIAVLRRKRRAA